MAEHVGRIRLAESMRAIGYCPIYYGIAHQFFKNEGLDLDIISGLTPVRACQLVLDGDADVAWGGPVRVLMNHQRDPDCPLICFGRIIARDPFILIGREARERFHFRDLIGLRVAVPNDVPTAWLTFQDDLKRAGVSPQSVDCLPAKSMRENVAMFLTGGADVIQVFEPYADAITSVSRGHEWHRFSSRGDICYTTFYTTRRFAKEDRVKCGALVQGLSKTQRSFDEASPKSIAETLMGYFPDVDVGALARGISRYKEEQLWADNPALAMDAYLRLKGALVSGGLITSDIPYERIIDHELSGSYS